MEQDAHSHYGPVHIISNSTRGKYSIHPILIIRILHKIEVVDNTLKFCSVLDEEFSFLVHNFVAGVN